MLWDGFLKGTAFRKPPLYATELQPRAGHFSRIEDRRFGRLADESGGFVKGVALLVGEIKNPQGNKGWGKHQDQDSGVDGVDSTRAGSGGVLVAHRAALGAERRGAGDER